MWMSYDDFVRLIERFHRTTSGMPDCLWYFCKFWGVVGQPRSHLFGMAATG